ncbi:MAG: sugar transferase [Candidatus Gracilibacteria bacterium]|nr:sugar transferase [Candidatus Gracilibacteria bacterium]
MKRHELFFGMIKVPIEGLIVFMSFFLARDIRRITDLIPDVHLPIQTIDTQNLLGFALVGSLVYIILSTFSGLYRMRMYQSCIQEFQNILFVSLYWFFIYIAILYLSLGFIYTEQIPRLIVLFSVIIATFLVILERGILGKIETVLMQKGILEKTKILLLLRTKDEDIIEIIQESPMYELFGYAHKENIPLMNIPYVGGIKQVISVIQSHTLDEILVVQSDFTLEEIQEIFEYARIYGVRYRYVANSFETTKINTEISFLGKVPVIEIKNIGLTPWGRIWKRTFDIIFSFLSLIILSPVFLLVSILIYSQDRHNPFYKSQRVGKNGELFDMYKFRSMIMDAEKEKRKLLAKNERKDGPLFKIENDPRVTALGKWIRKFDIDELPQLYNVLIGNMSLIGPRPHLKDEVKLYKEYQKRVLTLKPGITGMGQTHGRHENTFDDEVRLDTFYIENWNLLLDMKILFKTVGVVLARKGR